MSNEIHDANHDKHESPNGHVPDCIELRLQCERLNSRNSDWPLSRVKFGEDDPVVCLADLALRCVGYHRATRRLACNEPGPGQCKAKRVDAKSQCL